MLFVLFCITLISIGLLWRKAAATSAGYFLAGRSLSGWQAGLAMAATAFGSSAILVSSQYVYERGLAGIWFSLATALGFGVLGLCFAARIRATGAHSLADYIGQQFGPLARWLSSLLIVVVELGFFALTVKSFAILARPLLPPAWAPHISDVWLQVGIAAVFVSYTLIGGLKADVIADIGKLTLVGCALLLVLLPVALFKTPWHTLPAGHWGFPFNAATKTGPLFMLNMLALMGLPCIVGGDVFEVLSARDAGAARRAMLLAGGVRAALAVAIALLGLAARALLPGLATPQKAVPLLAFAVLPPGWAEFVALALLAALLSTSDSVLLTTSTVLTLDIFRLGENAPMWISRALTLAVAVAGVSLAVVFPTLADAIRFSYTLLAAGISAPVVVALIAPRKKISGTAFIAAMLSGICAAWFWKSLDKTGSPRGIDPALFGSIVASAIAACAAMCARTSKAP